MSSANTLETYTVQKQYICFLKRRAHDPLVPYKIKYTEGETGKERFLVQTLLNHPPF
jgi:hypothetical protein